MFKWKYKVIEEIFTFRQCTRDRLITFNVSSKSFSDSYNRWIHLFFSFAKTLHFSLDL